MSQFIHLHNHTHFSLLDGAATVESLVNATVANGMPAVAMTDHGVLFGAVEFYKRATKAGIKPIIGCEAYVVTKGSRQDRGQTGEKNGRGPGKHNYHHILLLAKDSNGYRNLVKLVTLAFTEGYYFKPRLDVELLAKYHEGLVVTSACRGGVISAHLVSGNYETAREYAGIYKEIFGEDFYVEIQNHGLEDERPILTQAPRLAREMGLKLVGTNDCHYIKREHALPHNIMLYIPEASSTNVPDYQTLRYGTDQLYFKSTREMQEAFREFPEAISSTMEIAEKCDLKLELKKNHMPAFPIPPESGMVSPDDYFDKLAREGVARRYPVMTEEVTQRLDLELDVIKKMGYAGYFLIVQDFISAARHMGVRVGPGRGSAAGSIVAYALGITNVDPLRFDLLFERFLNPDRISMPDIDIDFADDRREMVIDYVRKKYGERSVAQIVTFGTLSSRAVLKDIARVLGIPLGTIDPITKQIPIVQGRVTPIEEALNTIPELKWIKESGDEKIRLLVETAKVLEGMNRNVSTHAAGVVIAPGDITDFVPLYKTPQTDLMTQYNMKDLEEAGLLKMDFLGLRTLTVLENALTMIREGRGVEVDLDLLPDADPETLGLFARGQTVALFQFESSGMQDYLRKLQPSSINDLVAMNALYRPGPMDNIPDFIDRKHGRQRITYLHPKLEPILRDTYGIIVYQEQVMKIASEIGGMSLAQADILRRAMGKKDKTLMGDQKKKFVEGAVTNHVERKTAGEIFDLIEKFASYGFNKSHSVAYSVLAYQTAYLKAHYPAEYMAATLTSEMSDTGKIVVLIDECRKMGIDVLPPDVNESGVSFVVSPKGVRFGLSAIKGVGEGAVEGVVRARSAQGRFHDLFDFCSRVDLRLANKKTIESLVQAGAFDSIDASRSSLFASVEAAVAHGAQAQEHSGRGQSGLFDSGDVKVQTRPRLKTAEPWAEADKLERERSVLGFYVSGHPLMKYRDEVEGLATARLGEPGVAKPNSTVRVCGIVGEVKKKIDRRGETMAFITLEDFTGKAECIVFADPFKKYGRLLVPGAMVMVIGKHDGGSDQFKVLVNEVVAMEEVRKRFTKGVVVSVNLDSTREEALFELSRLMERHRGKCLCYFQVAGGGLPNNSIYSTRKFAIDPSPEFVAAVRLLFGPGTVRLQG